MAVGLGREAGVQEVQTTATTTTTTSMEAPAVVVVVVADQGEGEEVRRHLYHPPGLLLPQTTCWTRTSSLVSPFPTPAVHRLILCDPDDDPHPPPPPPRRPEPPKSNPAPKMAKAIAPPKPKKTTVTTTATTTTKATVRPQSPAPVPSTSTVPYCECGYPALETSIILARGPPCKQWGCGNLGKCEFFQVDKNKNPAPIPLIPQKRPSSEHVRIKLTLSWLSSLIAFSQNPTVKKVANRLCYCNNIAILSGTSTGRSFWGCPDEKCTFMEWASSTATQPRTRSMEPSDYVGAVGRSREADVCFKVCRVRAGAPLPGLTTTTVQPDRSLGVKLVFACAYI